LLVEETALRLSAWLKERVREAGVRGLVVGLSGGIDSAVVAGLCKRACPDSTLGVIMPCYSNPQDAIDAQLAARAFDVPVETVVLDEVFDLLVRKLTGKPYDPNKKDLPTANIKARLRMVILYYYANKLNALVAGTSNKSELTVGYFTKYGDGAADLLPIGNLVKGQVKELARYLGVPQTIIDKPPSAGLWPEHQDEAEFGFSYYDLDRYILTGEAPDAVREAIAQRIRKSQHKRCMPLLPPF